MFIACWINKATDTHSEYVTLIAFPLQQWLQERASMLRYTQIMSLLLLVLFQRNMSSYYLHNVYLLLNSTA
jgi:hypothetical protein